ncbi:cytochrome P450 [Nitrosomonas sp. Is37]|uniref:cytochrome P450 n=1 Tax=Nitrosomonas sp. Is37 TaxID=3080535 RepID=UPI00294AA3DC|nr:cytochrome P450 [Nitrosomonas sp. Is37]MDV6343309.1 cytochrome P450 [Nitrosomonas sp. Is37]
MSFLSEFSRTEVGPKQAQLFNIWVRQHTLELFAELRANEPNFVVTAKGPIVVTQFRDVQEVLSRPTVFTVRGYAPKMDPSVGPYMLARDDTALNQRDKSVMWTMLRREDLPNVRKMVADLADKAITAGLSQGRLEVVSNVSRKVILQMTGAYSGFPGPDIETMMRWSRATQNDMFHNFPQNDEAVHQASVQAGAEMRAYLQELIPQRRAELEKNPELDDTLSRLLKTKFPDIAGFNEERIISNIMGLLVGAGETSSAAIVQSLDVLLDRPNEFNLAKQAAQDGNDELLSNIVWEALRFKPQAPFVVRICAEPYTIAAGSTRAVTVQPGMVVLASIASAMHDENELVHPNEFRTDRPDYHYMHLGYGHHRCLGDHISKVQVPEIMKRLLLRKGLRRSPDDLGRLDFKGGSFPEAFYVDMDS